MMNRLVNAYEANATALSRHRCGLSAESIRGVIEENRDDLLRARRRNLWHFHSHRALALLSHRALALLSHRALALLSHRALALLSHRAVALLSHALALLTPDSHFADLSATMI